MKILLNKSVKILQTVLLITAMIISSFSGVVTTETVKAAQQEEDYKNPKIFDDKDLPGTFSKQITGMNSDTETVDIELKVSGKNEIKPGKNVYLVMVIDSSESMNGGGGERKEALKQAYQKVVSSFFGKPYSERIHLGIVDFNSKASTKVEIKACKGTYSESAFKNYIEEYKVSGATNTAHGIILAKNMLKEIKAKSGDTKAIILLTDGEPTYGITEQAVTFDAIYGLDGYCGYAERDEATGSIVEFQATKYRENWSVKNWNDCNISVKVPSPIKHTDASGTEPGYFRLDKAYDSLKSGNYQYDVKSVKTTFTSTPNTSFGAGGKMDKITEKATKMAVDAAKKELGDNFILCPIGIKIADEYKQLMKSLAVNAAYYDTSDLNKLTGNLETIVKNIAFAAIKDLEITDPMGEMFTLQDYSVTVKLNKEWLETVTIQKTSDKIILKGKEGHPISLGEEDTLTLTYQVKFKSEDPDFKVDQFYYTNQDTVFKDGENKILTMKEPDLPQARLRGLSYQVEYYLQSLDGTRYEKIRTDAYSTSVSKPKVEFGYAQKMQFEGGDYQYRKTVFAGNTYKDDLYTTTELKITNKEYVIEVYYDLVRSPKVHIMNQDKEKQSPLSGGSFLIEGVRIEGIYDYDYDYDDDYTGAFDKANDFKDPSFNQEIIIDNNQGYYGKFPCGLYRITQLKAAEGYMVPKEPFYFGIFLAGKYTTGTANYNLNDDEDNFHDEYQAFRFVKNENGSFQQEPIEWDNTDRAFPFIIENTRMVSDTIYNYYRKDSESGPIKGAKFSLYKKKEQVGVRPVSPDREEGGFDKEEPTALTEEPEKAKAELQSLEEEQKVQGENVDTAHSTVTEEKGQGGELVVPESKSTDDSSEPLQNVENLEIKEESINSSVNPLQAEELPSNQEKNEIESTADGETPTVSLSDKEETGASVTHSSDELGRELPADENQVSKALDDSKEKIMQLKEKIKKLEIQSLNDKSQSAEESTDSGEAEEEYNKIGEFTTDANGLILNKEGKLLSLNEGAYYLIQTVVPDFEKGKLKLRENKFFFQIGADGRMTLPYDSGIETVATTENSVEEKTGYIIYNTLEVPEVEEPKPDLPKEQPEPPKEEEPVPSVFIEPLPLPNPIEDPSEKIEEDPAPLSEPNDEPQTAIEDEDVILEDDEETVIEDTEPVPLENLEEELDMEEIPLSDIPKTSDRRLGIFYIPVLIMAALLLRSVEKIKKQDE